MNWPLLVRMASPFVAAAVLAALLMPLRHQPGLGRPLRGVLVTLAVANLALVGFLVSRQVGFPLHLDLMEGAVLEHVGRAAAGEPIYPAPGPEFVALSYNPLYYEIGAAVSRFTGGPNLRVLRMLSASAAAASGLIVFAVAWLKTGGVWWGLLASGLFAAAYGVMECYLVTVHSDSWFLVSALAGTLVLDRTRSRGGSLVGMTLLLASFWFKQHGAFFVIGGLVYLLLRDGRRSWPSWALAVVLGPGVYVYAGPTLFGPYFHFFTWEVPRHWGTELRVRSLLRYAGFIGLFYPVLAASSLVSLARHWRRPGVWHVQLVSAMLTGLMGALDRGSAENVFIPMGTLFILVGTIGLAEWSLEMGRSALPEIALLLAFVTLAYDPRLLTPSPRAASAYADLLGWLRDLGGPVLGPWQGQLPSGFVLRPPLHWVALEDLARGPGRRVRRNPEVMRLTGPALHPTGPAFVLANQPLEAYPVLRFLTDDYVLACDLGDRFAALRVLSKRYDHGWPRYLYRNRTQQVDMASLRRLCATS